MDEDLNALTREEVPARWAPGSDRRLSAERPGTTAYAQQAASTGVWNP